MGSDGGEDENLRRTKIHHRGQRGDAKFAVKRRTWKSEKSTGSACATGIG
jgi:hypothetical protein